MSKKSKNTESILSTSHLLDVIQEIGSCLDIESSTLNFPETDTLLDSWEWSNEERAIQRISLEGFSAGYLNKIGFGNVH